VKLRKYETIYVTRADLTEDQHKQLFERIEGIVIEHGGRMLRVDNWGVRRTAYPIQKHAKAQYMQVTYAGKPGVVAQVERLFRILDEVMKFFSNKVTDEISVEELGKELVRTEPQSTDTGDRRERRDRDDRRDDRRDRRDRGDRDDYRGRRRDHDDDDDDGDDDDDLDD
jgi:small subunit ribosomal protein S6